MASVMLRTRAGGTVELSADTVEAFEAGLNGRLIHSSSPDYDEQRTIWNAMIDKRPALIAQVSGAADVIHCVNFAREHDLLVSIRGAGHNIAGTALAEGGLVIDQSTLRHVHVDVATRRVRVSPGATLGDVDHECQAHGLAVPTGINSTTGIAGLTLGGGFGWLTRKHGMTVDNLISVDVVTAAGELVRANASQHPDLFWALRGGGGNFGVVTSFEFQAHPVGPMVWAGMLVFPADDAAGLLRKYRAYAATIPDELTVWTVMRKAPPLPFLPESVHGTDVVVFAFLYCGADHAEGDRLIAPVHDFGTAHGTHIGAMPFAGFQQAFDPLLTPGLRNYWKTHDFLELSDGLIDTLAIKALEEPSGHCEVFLAQLGGAASRVPAGATAYSQRDVTFTLNVHGRWEDASDDDRCVAWARGTFEAAGPYATGTAYVNFMTDDEQDRVASAYGANHARLVEIKHRYDPDNLFRTNMNLTT